MVLVLLAVIEQSAMAEKEEMCIHKLYSITHCSRIEKRKCMRNRVSVRQGHLGLND